MTKTERRTAITKLRNIARALSAVVRLSAPTTMQGAGLVLVATGFYVLAPWLGLVSLGLAMCFVGWALDGDE